jgi:hypothetical protein
MKITWIAGGEGEVTVVDDLHVTVASSKAFPPGAPAHGTLHDASPVAFTLKVAGSRKEGERFAVRGRLVNATAAIREAFARAASPAPERE